MNVYVLHLEMKSVLVKGVEKQHLQQNNLAKKYVTETFLTEQ